MIKAQSWSHIFIVVALLIGAALPLMAQNKALERSFDTKILPKIAGCEWQFQQKTISVKGRLFDNYGVLYGQPQDFVTFDLREGWDWFTGFLGVEDDRQNVAGTIYFEVDGETIQTLKYNSGTVAVSFRIPLTGKKSLTLRRTAGGGFFFEPKLIKGNPITTPSTVNNNIANPPLLTNQPATFVIDPNDLDKLALALRKRVDGKAEIKGKLANGYMAVMTFNLIDIPSPSVAQNVAEDLSTRMINAEFSLVERGQLDKALKELKIQDSGMIDQATAQKLGQITGCNFILVGSVSDRGQFIVMNARILETATGKAVAAESVECRKIEIKR